MCTNRGRCLIDYVTDSYVSKLAQTNAFDFNVGGVIANEVAEETRVAVPANAWIITVWLHLGSFVVERESSIEAGETDSQHRIRTKTLAKRFWRRSSSTAAVDSIYAVSNPDLLDVGSVPLLSKPTSNRRIVAAWQQAGFANKLPKQSQTTICKTTVLSHHVHTIFKLFSRTVEIM